MAGATGRRSSWSFAVDRARANFELADAAALKTRGRGRLPLISSRLLTAAQNPPEFELPANQSTTTKVAKLIPVDSTINRWEGSLGEIIANWWWLSKISSAAREKLEGFKRPLMAL